MKKIILTLLLLSSIVSMNLKANPIGPPPVVSELYFIGNDWQIELFFEQYVISQYGINSSDSLFLITSTDTASFEPGWTIGPNSLIVITKDSLLSPIPINKNGDYIFVAYKQNGVYYNLDEGIDEFAFGNYPGAMVTAPLPGQSIKRSMHCNFYLVKDNNPTIGYDEYHATGTVIAEGYVYDLNHHPVPGAYVFENNCYPNSNHTTTDSNGYFHLSGMDARYNHVGAYKQFCTTLDTALFIEPDSTYQFEFTFNCYLGINDNSKTPDHSLQVFPNPGSGNFTFVINTTQASKAKQLIKIYDAAGELVNIIPVGDVNSTTVSVPWDGKGKYSNLSAGMYTCSLEISGRVIASVKLVIN